MFFNLINSLCGLLSIMYYLAEPYTIVYRYDIQMCCPKTGWEHHTIPSDVGKPSDTIESPSCNYY